MPTKAANAKADFRIKKHKKLISQKGSSLLPKVATQIAGQNQTLASSGRSATQFVAQGTKGAPFTASSSALATKRPFTRSDMVDSGKILKEKPKMSTAHSQRIFASLPAEAQQPLYNEY